MRFGPVDLAFHFQHGVVTKHLLVNISAAAPGRVSRYKNLGRAVSAWSAALVTHMCAGGGHFPQVRCTFLPTDSRTLCLQRDVLLEGMQSWLGQPRLSKLTFWLSGV